MPVREGRALPIPTRGGQLDPMGPTLEEPIPPSIARGRRNPLRTVHDSFMMIEGMGRHVRDRRRAVGR
jgi:hypothetical protein